MEVVVSQYGTKIESETMADETILRLVPHTHLSSTEAW